LIKILFFSWIKRVKFTFVVATIALFALNYAQYGFSRNMVINSVVWALAAAMIASSLSTYMAYRRLKAAAKKID
jgi:hypothetical protein